MSRQIAKIMKERGMNQVEMAKALGITASHLCKVLKGQRRLGPMTALAAAREFGVPMESFFSNRGKVHERNHRADL